MGQFGDVFRISLWEGRPAEYARLETGGVLKGATAYAEARGQQIFESAMAALLRENPVPGADLERVRG